MSEAVNAEAVEIVVGEIQSESSSEVPDSPFELVSSERSDGGCGLL